MAEPTKADEPTIKEQAVIKEIADWIDPTVIAMVIAEELVDLGQPVTVETCKATWYKVLKDIRSHVHEAIWHRL